MPGLTIADELNKMDIRTIFIGTKYGMERNILKGRDLYLLPIKGFVKVGIKRQIFIPFRLMFSIFIALHLLRKLGVKCVISTGGYASIPSIISAKILSIPVFLLEVNAVPGAAAKVASIFATEIYVGFPVTKKFFTRKSIYTGVPVRNIGVNVSREEAVKHFGLSSDRKTVLVFGGSGGAKKILELTKSLIKILPKSENIQFIIQKGKYGIDIPGKFPIRVKDYIEEMEIAYRAADVIISRAGASSVEEIYLTGKPAIFIPYPYAYKDHQYLNAKSMEKKGIRIVLRENTLTPEILYKHLCSIIGKKGEKKMNTAAKFIAKRIKGLCLAR